MVGKKLRLSEGAKQILDYLKAKGIVYRLEATYTDCKDVRKLRFDFEIIINGRVAVIEFDGEQHFRYTRRFHDTIEKYEKQRAHDITKTTYTYQNNISLLRIDYACNTKEKVNALLDVYIAALRSGKVVYHFSDTALYKQHYNLCYNRFCSIM